jgi:hypothetical protein
MEPRLSLLLRRDLDPEPSPSLLNLRLEPNRLAILEAQDSLAVGDSARSSIVSAMIVVVVVVVVVFVRVGNTQRAFWTTVMFLCTRCKNEILIPSSIFHVSDQQKRVWNIPGPSIPQKNFSFHYARLPDTMHLRKSCCAPLFDEKFALLFSQLFTVSSTKIESCFLSPRVDTSAEQGVVSGSEERNLSDPVVEDM